MTDAAGNPNSWTTALTQIEPNRVSVRGYDIAELMGNISFGAAVYLMLRGELPDDQTARLMDAILVSSIDHGVTPPSVNAARTVASTGASLSASVAAGVLAINQYHGGAIEKCAEQLAAVVARIDAGSTPEDAAEHTLGELRAAGQRMSGFGHRIHTSDPRTDRLFELAQQANVSGRFVEAARAVERCFVKAGKPLPINVDGAIAAVLADMDFEPGVMNGLFMIARSVGLVAHVHEEKETQRPMRKIDAAAHVYTGPASRSLNV